MVEFLGKSTIAGTVTETARTGTQASEKHSEITADSFWNMESPGEDLSRLAPLPTEIRPPSPLRLSGSSKKLKKKVGEFDLIDI